MLDDAKPVMMSDGFANAVANLNTSRDKANFGAHTYVERGEAELLQIYRASSLAQRMVKMPVNDAVRNWREWQADAKQISAIEAEEKRLGVKPKVTEAKRLARLFGGAAIYIGVGQENTQEELNPASIRRGGLLHLNVLQKSHLSPTEIETDATSPLFGRPRSYIVQGGTSVVEIHPSRLVIFDGVEVPAAMTQNFGWGDSVLQSNYAEIRKLEALTSNIESMSYEAVIDVLSLPGLANDLRTRGEEAEANIRQRLEVAMTAKGINGTLVLDGNEEHSQKSLSFGGLAELVDRLMILCSMACGVPVSLLFGRSTAGLNSSGDADSRNYYDQVRLMQELEFGAPMSVLDDCLVQSGLGVMPEEVHYRWAPLWQPSESERAENADKIASAFEKVQRMGVVPDEALGEAVVNAFTEGGIAPGLEAAAEKYFDPGDDGEEDDPTRTDPSEPQSEQ